MENKSPLKLNLGCGYKKKPQFINVDKTPTFNPDVVLDLHQQTWPWPDSSVEHVCFDYSLEQMGTDISHLRHILSELYRVCKNDAKIEIVALHPRHDQFFLNPLCTHRLSPDFFQTLSISQNLNAIAYGQHYDLLGLEWGVNFVVQRFKLLVDHSFLEKVEKGECTEEQIRARIKNEFNICNAFEVDLGVVKSS